MINKFTKDDFEYNEPILSVINKITWKINDIIDEQKRIESILEDIRGLLENEQ